MIPVREMFGLAEDKCAVCQMKLTDGVIESHRKKFCSIDCTQEYPIELKEAELIKRIEALALQSYQSSHCTKLAERVFRHKN